MECSVKTKNKEIRKLRAFKEFKMNNGTTIGIFQGSYGSNPELDIIIKYQEPGKRVRTPKHIHWAIDLLIKREHNRELTLEFIKYLSEMWAKVEPFTSKGEQQKCELHFTNSEHLQKYQALNQYGEYPVEFIGHVIELMMIEEKTGNHDAFMFKGVLDALYSGADIFQIVQKATFRGRLS
jgi:hypothetical protein